MVDGICASLSPMFPPGEEEYTSLPTTSLMWGFDVGDSHWPTPMGRRSSVPVLSRSFEKPCKL